MKHDFLSINLDALRVKDPRSAGEFQIHPRISPSRKWVIEESGSGILCANAVNPDGGRIPLHHNGSIQPKDDITSQIETSKSVFIVFGFGLAYHIEALLETIEENTAKRCVVFDFVSEFLIDVLRRKDARRIIENPCVKLCLRSSPEELQNEINNHIGVHDSTKINIIIDYSSFVLFPEESKKVIRYLKDYVRQLDGEFRTFSALSKTWHINTLNNIDRLFGSATVCGLSGAFTNVPMYVVGAGPSLKKNIEELKNIKGSLIYACGTALEPLLKRGIRPHFIGACDSNSSIISQIEGQDLSGIRLLTDIITPASFLDAFEPSKRFFYFGTYNATAIFMAERLNIPKSIILDTGGNVATAGLSFGIMLGCNPIVMVGQDLALSDDNCLYDSSTVNKKCSSEGVEIVQVEGEMGGTVSTIPVFRDYLFLKEKIMRGHNFIRFINATEGGAKHAAAQSMKLKDAVQQFSHPELDIESILCAASSKSSMKPRSKAAHSVIMDFIVELQRILYPLHRLCSGIEKAGIQPESKNAPSKNKKELSFLAGQFSYFHDEVNRLKGFFSLPLFEIQASIQKAHQADHETLLNMYFTLWKCLQDSVASLKESAKHIQS